MVLDPSGNLGLGVTPSAWNLSGLKAFQIGAVSTIFDFSDNLYITRNRIYDSGNKYQKNGFAQTYEQDSLGQHVWLNAPSGTAGNAISFTQAMTLDSSGRLFLGATAGTGSERMLIATNSSGTFTQGLNIRDDNASADGNNFVVFRRSDDTYIGTINRSGTSNGLSINGNEHLAFAVGFTERMRITSSGRVLIGTPPPTESTYQLDVNGTGRVQTSLTISSTTNSSLVAATNSTTGYTFVDLINNGASGKNYQIGVGGNGAASGYANNLYFDLVGVGNVMTLTSGRNVLIGTTTDAGYKLDVNGTFRATGAATFSNNVTLGNTASSSNALATFQNNVNGFQFGFASNTTQRFTFINGGGTEIASISGTGAAIFSSTVTATGFFESSSIKGKDIIKTNPLTNLNLDVIQYTRKTDENKDVRYGYSAEQIHSLMPELTDKDVTAVKYLDVHTLLIAQLQQEIKELKAKLN
jgi:hypothetical protein